MQPDPLELNLSKLPAGGVSPSMPTNGAQPGPSRFVLLPDGSAVDPAEVVGWRDAGPDATELYLASGAHFGVYVASSVVARLLGAAS